MKARALAQFSVLLLLAVLAASCGKEERQAPPPAAPPAATGPAAPAPQPEPVAPSGPPEVPPPPPQRPAPVAPGEPAPPPETPVGVTALGASRTVELTWQAPPGPTRPRRYEVLRGDAVVASTAGTKAKVTDLDNGLEYCFTVRSVDARDQRSEPSPPACAFAYEKDKPPAPTGLVARALSPSEIEIGWKPLPAHMAPGGYEVRGGESPVLSAGDSARATRLAPGKRHCFTVFSLGAGQKRGFPSEAVCAETPPDVTPPTVPSGLTAVALAGRIQLQWQASTDDVGGIRYEILEGGEVTGSVTETYALVSDVRPGEHCYEVRAVDGSGNRSAPSAQACARPPDVSPPSRPTGVSAVASRESEVVVRWKASTDDVGVTGYEVLRDGKVVAQARQTEARETGLRGTSRYCYAVVALDAAGNRSPRSDEACVSTPDQTPPTTPPGVAAAASAEGERVELRWDAASDDVAVTGYEVLRGKEQVARLGADARTWSDVGPKPSAESCYAVRALDAAGNASPASARACVKTPDRTPPATPEGLVAAPASSTQIALSWGASTDNVGVAGYEVLRDGRVVAQSIRASAAVGGLGPRQEGCFAVQAFDAAGNRSRPSAVACAVTTDVDAVPAPRNLEAIRVGPDEVRIRWDPLPDADVTYLVFWDATRAAGVAGAKARTLGTTRTPAFKVFGPPARERRCYRVVARTGNRDSAETLPACVEAAAPGH